jgi:hypothetical protein
MARGGCVEHAREVAAADLADFVGCETLLQAGRPPTEPLFKTTKSVSPPALMFVSRALSFIVHPILRPSIRSNLTPTSSNWVFILGAQNVFGNAISAKHRPMRCRFNRKRPTTTGTSYSSQ